MFAEAARVDQPPCVGVQETDPSARRNAFLMLFNCAQDLAVDYYLQHAEETTTYGDGFQLIVLELTRKVRVRFDFFCALPRRFIRVTLAAVLPSCYHRGIHPLCRFSVC